MEQLLLRWLRASRGRRFLLIIAGRLSGIHGWRREHLPIAYQVIGSTVIIHFEGSESLTISDATGLTLHPDGQFVAQDASEVRFAWCSETDPDKDCEEIFTKGGLAISFSRTDDLYTTSTLFALPEPRRTLLRLVGRVRPQGVNCGDLLAGDQKADSAFAAVDQQRPITQPRVQNVSEQLPIEQRLRAHTQ